MMKNLVYLALLVAALALLVLGCQDTPNPTEQNNLVALDKKDDCTTIQQGTLTYSVGHYLEGQPLMTGNDPFGYNYQAQKFDGSYFNSYAGGQGWAPYEGDDDAYLLAYPAAESYWAWPYRNDHLAMKWNDAWLSNQDCDHDGSLDRHYGFDGYIGSGAWLTNHQSGTYEDEEGNTCHWTYFVKIVAAPSDAYKDGGVWYDVNGTEIGPVIWTDFAVIQEVYNDPCGGFHGVSYLSPAGPGFGHF